MSAKAEAKAAAALRELGATLRTKCPAETMCVYDFTCVMSLLSREKVRPSRTFSRPLRKGQLRTSHTNALTTSATGIDLLSRLEDADDREPDGTNVQLAQV